MSNKEETHYQACSGCIKDTFVPGIVKYEYVKHMTTTVTLRYDGFFAREIKASYQAKSRASSSCPRSIFLPPQQHHRFYYRIYSLSYSTYMNECESVHRFRNNIQSCVVIVLHMSFMWALYPLISFCSTKPYDSIFTNAHHGCTEIKKNISTLECLNLDDRNNHFFFSKDVSTLCRLNALVRIHGMQIFLVKHINWCRTTTTLSSLSLFLCPCAEQRNLSEIPKYFCRG